MFFDSTIWLAQLLLIGLVHPNPGPVTTPVLHILSVNANGLKSKTKRQQLKIIAKDCDILAVQETKMSPDIQSSELSLPKYDVYRKDRTNRGGGVLLAINKKMRSSEIALPHNEAEIIAAKIPQKSRYIYIIPKRSLSGSSLRYTS